VPGAQTVNEDTALTFTGAQAISVSDVDGNVATTRLTVAQGTLTVSLAGGATISAGANGTANLTLCVYVYVVILESFKINATYPCFYFASERIYC
jgi:hypothetical protein